MLRRIIFSIFLLTEAAVSQDALHVFYYSGETIERISSNGLTVSVTFKDIGRANQVAVFVQNGSSEAVNVISSDFALHEDAPKEGDIKIKLDQDVQKLGGRNTLAHAVSKMGTGLSVAKDKLAGNEAETPSESAVNFDAQARWLAHANQLGEKGQTAALGRMYLRGTTLFPRSVLSGVLWFDRDHAPAAATVRVTFGAHSFEFPFPPPASATTPPNPDNPEKAEPAVADSAASVRDGRVSSKAGVLGVAGEDWAQGETKGVKILEVTQNSAADISGLRVGYVITEFDAEKISSTKDLAAALAQRGPGSRVRLTYLFWTNLGWMSKEAAVILSSGN